MKDKRFIIYIIISLIILSACSSTRTDKKYLIGLSQCMLDDAWRQSMVKELLIEASNYDNLEIIIKDANSNNQRQIEQIRELINMQVDVLIISPFESQPITAVAEEAYRAGIPTIITDRKVNTSLYTTFVGADNYLIGRNAGNYASRYLPKNAVIMEIWGLSSSSPAQERHQGFVDALSTRSDVTYRKIEGEWLYRVAKERVEKSEHLEHVDFIYAHNDMMAIAAREVFDARCPDHSKQLQIIGMDAVPGAGLEAVADGRINASFMYPTGGEQLIRTVMQILNRQPVPKEISLETADVDRKTAQSLLLQAHQLQNYQQRIERQTSRTAQLLDRYRFLQSSLGLISALMLGVIILLIYVFFINRKIRKVNRELREKNLREEEQNRKLISLNAEIEEVTAQKLRFFTNISHEVRTPLTLIISPLDRLMQMLYDSPYLPDLQLIRKNADRLLRIINQILDFQKVEGKEMKVKIQQSDMVLFAGEIKSYFESMATVRNITYTFTSDVERCAIWFDPDMIEKVLVNLLSNAFKFTPKGGCIRLSVTDAGEKVMLRVEDNGCGISHEKLPFLFDRFYTDNNSSGTGIGLHLVKEYMQMHGGDISVESDPGIRTVFTLCFYKDKEHIQGENVTEAPAASLSYGSLALDNREEQELLSAQYPYTVLVVEDDEDVSEYLRRELRHNFKVLAAQNGSEALAVLQEQEVSLVLSDVMMPVMNGFELCRKIKTDLSFSHIPVLLLTALSDDRQRVFGISCGADVYIRKPFHLDYLKVVIIRVLEERKRLRDKLQQQLQQGTWVQEVGKCESMDEIFLHKLGATLEKIYTDPDFNVEKLSEMIGLSRQHLYRKVKELTGITPVEFLRNYRLSKAAELLKQKRYNVSEVAYQTGFSSPAYFTKCFKTVYKVTPTEF
ncbi:hybrid sensor histidine kinase/response regulator transcription factor [Parabacteroides pacaensis]|uniref:hybrid sensor histidine kinase/response regulator transcription factor n=1 Tax=Parabacteroides pacaensis TaxID=2086575 RepID=UPI001F17071B|nr:substrate-binding domain-containing protein [Parabacteroides pacaensis]